MKAFERIKSFAEYVGEVTNLRARPIVRATQYDGLFYREADLTGRTGIRVALTRWESVWLSVDRLAPSDPPAPAADISSWVEVGSDPAHEPRRLDRITVKLPAEEAEIFVASGRVAREDIRLESESDGEAPGEGRQADVTLRLDAFPELAAKIEGYIDGAWRDWANAEIPKREAIKIYDELRALADSSGSGEEERQTELVWGVGALRWNHVKLGRIDHPVIEIPLEIDVEKMSEKISIRPRWQSARLAEPFLGLLPGDGMAEYIKSERSRISDLIDAGEKITPFRKQTFEPILLNCAARIDPVGVYYPRGDGHPGDGSQHDAPAQPIVTDGWSVYVRPKVEPPADDIPGLEPAPSEDAAMEVEPIKETPAEVSAADDSVLESEPITGEEEQGEPSTIEKEQADSAPGDSAEAEPDTRMQDDEFSPGFESGSSNADDGEVETEAPDSDDDSAAARDLPSIEISLAGPVSKAGRSNAVSRPKALAALGGLALVGIALTVYSMMPSKEERAVQRQAQTLATVEGSQPSGLSPRGELADYFNLTSRRTDDQRADKVQAIRGEIVLWSLPVQSVSKQEDGIYKVQTSAFMDTVGTVVTLHTRNDDERKIVEGLETGDWITIKGKIAGVASHDVEIVDAIPIAK